MERFPVTSTDINSVGYDIESQILEIEFHNGGVYQYFGVPQNIYDELMGSVSKGKYFNMNIKKAGYSFSKLQTEVFISVNANLLELSATLCPLLEGSRAAGLSRYRGLNV
jgi:hypothetical protein